jgi:predicted phosphodiesterase
MTKFWQASDSSSSSDSENEKEKDISIEKIPLSVDELSADPDVAWKHIADTQVFETIPYSNTSTRDPDCVRLVCISDTHGKHREVQLPPADILLHAGDFTNTGETGSIQDLSAYFEESGFSEVVCIAGNHDLPLHPEFYKENWKRFHRKPFDTEVAQSFLTHCVYLNDTSYGTKQGLAVYGSPWSPFFFDWAFNLCRGEEIREKWKHIPDATDILITHGPPLGRGDLTSNNVRAGCYDLLVEVQKRVKPRVHIFGHIHEGVGVTYDGNTLYVNACNVNLSYQVVNYPIVVEVPLDKTRKATVVRPNCTKNPTDFLEWCKQQKYDLLVEYMEDNDLSTLPTGNKFFDEDAYATIANHLCLHRDRKAGKELKRALANLYAQSFSQ